MLFKTSFAHTSKWTPCLVRWFAKHHPPNDRPGQYMNGLIDLPYTALSPKYKDYAWTVYPGDEVEIVIGPEAGSRGKVLAVYRDDRMPLVLVEGRNMKKKRVREGLGPSDFFVVTIEAPLLYDQVLLIDPVTGKAVKSVVRYTEDGTAVRVTRGPGSSGTIMKIPPPPKDPLKGLPGEKDTKKEDALQQTYDPDEPLPFRIPVVNHGHGKSMIQFYSTQSSQHARSSCTNPTYLRWIGLPASGYVNQHLRR